MKYYYSLLLLFVAFFGAINTSSAQCSQPNFLQADSITGTSAFLSWLPVTGATSYDVAITTSQTPPQAGTTITSTYYKINGLSPNRLYCFHVRANCPGGASVWSYQCFYTTCVDGNDSLKVTIISENSVMVSWNKFATDAIFECALTKDLFSPSTGSTTTNESILFEGLKPLTYYCFHLRAYCEPTSSYTDWHSECFTIPVTTAINNINDKNAPVIYPNPVQNELNIKLPELNSSHFVTIKDITGRTVYNTTTESVENKINTSDLANGMYIITISGKEYNSVQKVSVNK